MCYKMLHSKSRHIIKHYYSPIYKTRCYNTQFSVTIRNILRGVYISSVLLINSLTFLILFPWQRAYLYANYDYSNIGHRQNR